jgi:hypothetical protein
MTEPFEQAHFLKVPELPYHLLVSILQKYPKDSVVGGDGDALFGMFCLQSAICHLCPDVLMSHPELTSSMYYMTSFMFML